MHMLEVIVRLVEGFNWLNSKGQ